MRWWLFQDQQQTFKSSNVNLQSSSQQNDGGKMAGISGVGQRPYAVSSNDNFAWTGLDEGYIKLSYVKSVEAVDSYDLDIEVYYW